MMQQRIWFVFAIIAGVGFAVQVSLPTDLSDRPETTFDTAPRGHAGVYALLRQFEATSGRWLSGVTLPGVDETIWWIAPARVCDERSGGPLAAGASDNTSENASDNASDNTSVDSDGRRPSAFEIALRPWLEAGGTGVVWLSHPSIEIDLAQEPTDQTGEASGVEGDDREPDLREQWGEGLARSREELHNGVVGRCEAILGMALPPRRLSGLEGGALPEEGRYSPVVFSVGRATARHEDFDYQNTRTLPGPTLGFFRLENASRHGPGNRRERALADWQRWRPLWVEADEATPLALERRMGDGRLVVIADARILSNARLGHVDSAPFVFDWVRDYGRPWIDEHAHGVVPETGTFRYLAQSPAWAAGLGLMIVGVLVAWRGHAWPTRSVSEFDPEAPSLATFVDSLARLYSGTQDHTRVFDGYRVVCLDRIRRALGLAPGTSVEIILGSLRARAGNWPELEETGLRHLLMRPISISSAAELARNVASLDDLVSVLRDRSSTRSK